MENTEILLNDFYTSEAKSFNSRRKIRVVKKKEG